MGTAPSPEEQGASGSRAESAFKEAASMPKKRWRPSPFEDDTHAGSAADEEEVRKSSPKSDEKDKGHSGSHDDGGENLKCRQCGATSTPQWRNGKTMCNACYLRERKDKMLTKRRATAPAGAFPFALDAQSLPIGPPGSQGPKPGNTPPPQGSRLSGFARHGPGPGAAPGPPWMGHRGDQEAAFRRLEAAIAANPYAQQHQESDSRLKFRRITPPASAFYTPHSGMFPPPGMIPQGPPMGMVPPPSGGGSSRDGAPGMPPSLGGPSRGGGGGPEPYGSSPRNSGKGPPGTNSPDIKPTFSSEESLIRQMSLMDPNLAEALAVCASGYAEERCLARDKGYEARQRQMKSRLTSMLEGESQSSGVEEEMLRSIEKKAEENNRGREEELLGALRSCCSRLVDRWHDTQVQSVRAACEDGQRMAREDFTKHLYKCLNNDQK